MLAFGDDAKVIEAVWRKNLDPSSNIDRVNELTAAGMSLDEAIQQAWTVKQAMKAGFSNASVVGMPEGTIGNFTKIDVIIER
jgi:adenosylcobinamide amidohydrolase